MNPSIHQLYCCSYCLMSGWRNVLEKCFGHTDNKKGLEFKEGKVEVKMGLHFVCVRVRVCSNFTTWDCKKRVRQLNTWRLPNDGATQCKSRFDSSGNADWLHPFSTASSWLKLKQRTAKKNNKKKQSSRQSGRVWALLIILSPPGLETNLSPFQYHQFSHITLTEWLEATLRSRNENNFF